MLSPLIHFFYLSISLSHFLFSSYIPFPLSFSHLSVRRPRSGPLAEKALLLALLAACVCRLSVHELTKGPLFVVEPRDPGLLYVVVRYLCHPAVVSEVKDLHRGLFLISVGEGERGLPRSCPYPQQAESRGAVDVVGERGLGQSGPVAKIHDDFLGWGGERDKV